MFLSYVHRGQRVKCLGFATPEGLRPLTLDECESFPWLREGRDEWLRGLDAPIEFVEYGCGFGLRFRTRITDR